jgi:hypothetical protein
MAWADSVERAHATFLSIWGIAATLAPAATPGRTFPITGIIARPGMEEEFIPGGPSGVSVVRFWVDYNSISPQPVIGDAITINGVSYTVGAVDVDVEGGATLKLRRNA